MSHIYKNSDLEIEKVNIRPYPWEVYVWFEQYWVLQSFWSQYILQDVSFSRLGFIRSCWSALSRNFSSWRSNLHTSVWVFVWRIDSVQRMLVTFVNQAPTVLLHDACAFLYEKYWDFSKSKKIWCSSSFYSFPQPMYCGSMLTCYDHCW
jgi:hypothetical protein